MREWKNALEPCAPYTYPTHLAVYHLYTTVCLYWWLAYFFPHKSNQGVCDAQNIAFYMSQFSLLKSTQFSLVQGEKNRWKCNESFDATGCLSHFANVVHLHFAVMQKRWTTQEPWALGCSLWCFQFCDLHLSITDDKLKQEDWISTTQATCTCSSCTPSMSFEITQYQENYLHVIVIMDVEFLHEFLGVPLGIIALSHCCYDLNYKCMGRNWF